jgi:hypothetical protein
MMVNDNDINDIDDEIDLSSQISVVSSICDDDIRKKRKYSIIENPIKLMKGINDCNYSNNDSSISFIDNTNTSFIDNNKNMSSVQEKKIKKLKKQLHIEQ